MDPSENAESSGLVVSDVKLELPEMGPGSRSSQVSSSTSDSALWLNDSRPPDSLSNESGVSVEEPGYYLEAAAQDGNGSDGGSSTGEVTLESPPMILEETRDLTIKKLHDQLSQAQDELRAKNEKCVKLEQLQGNVDKEIQELTSSLFQEAYKMVTEANVKRVHSEKLLKEANGKMDVLQAEVEALKLLVLNNTPSSQMSRGSRGSVPGLSPSSHSRTPKKAGGVSPSGKSKFSIIHRRNNSDTPSTSKGGSVESEEETSIRKQLEFREVDPILHKEFTQWREKQDLLDKGHPFLRRVYLEEITPCMNFDAAQLASEVLGAIEQNTIAMEQVNEPKPKPRICPFRLKTEESADWIFVSQLCRNRIAAVCDFFTYLRYLQVGLVKAGLHDAYWETVRLRKNMSLARLGLGFLPAAGRKEER